MSAFVGFMILGWTSLWLHSQFLSELKIDFPEQFRTAGSPSVVCALFPVCIVNRFYMKWLLNGGLSFLPKKIARLYWLSQALYWAALLCWGFGYFG
jgi:hypothetical protein